MPYPVVGAFGGLPALRSWETAVNNCAGANGLFKRRLSGNASRRIFVGGNAGHVDDRKCRVDLARNTGNFPTVRFTGQVDISHKRAVFSLPSQEKGNCLLAIGATDAWKPPSLRASSTIP